MYYVYNASPNAPLPPGPLVLIAMVHTDAIYPDAPAQDWFDCYLLSLISTSWFLRSP